MDSLLEAVQNDVIVSISLHPMKMEDFEKIMLSLTKEYGKPNELDETKYNASVILKREGYTGEGYMVVYKIDVKKMEIHVFHPTHFVTEEEALEELKKYTVHSVN